VDPLAPDNPLIFAPGPLTGSGAPGAERYSVSARSPLTGTAFDGNSGGGLGAALRRLGLDYLVVTGACAVPSILLVRAVGTAAVEGISGPSAGRGHPPRGSHPSQLRLTSGGAVVVDVQAAGELWGCDVLATHAGLRQRFGCCEAAVIGPAGERGVLFASIVSDRGRQIGRGGLGAVMGAKNLKAIALDAPRGMLPGPADKRLFDQVVRDAVQSIRSEPATSSALPEYGTSVLVNLLQEVGALPTRNFRDSQFEHAEAISGEALRSRFVVKRSACAGCPVGCKRLTRGFNGRVKSGPEYESIWALGADCGVGDLGAILEANDACNRAGVDTISMGSTIACAMELTDLGLLPGGPRFGDAAAVLDLVQATASRCDLGDDLAEGSARFAARCRMPELSMSVKSLEMPAYDPRGMTAQGLAFATSNRGACHLRANMLGPEILGVPSILDRFASTGKAALLIELQNANAVFDSLCACKFTASALGWDCHARMLSAILGETVGPAELLAIGERIWTAERLFNLAAGFSAADDTLPARVLEEPVAAGPSAGHVVDLKPMLGEYYRLRGWNAHGTPTSHTLAAVDMEWRTTEGR
jgi:aldehyde:ferredoxin oxidoreductase